MTRGMQVDIDRLFSDEDSFLSHISMKTDRDIEIISKIFPPKTDERTFLTLPMVTAQLLDFHVHITVQLEQPANDSTCSVFRPHSI